VARAEALDIQALVEGQLAAGQGDGLAFERFGEPDRGAAICGSDRIPQGAGPTIEVVQDRQRAEHSAILKVLEPQATLARPTGRTAVGLPGQKTTFGMILVLPDCE
jgi:hypothetical protein